MLISRDLLAKGKVRIKVYANNFGANEAEPEKNSL